MIPSLPLQVLTLPQNLPVSLGFGNNASAFRINQREPVPGAINPKGVM